MTKQERADFLRELKADINDYTEFSCTYPFDDDIENFIWVKTKDAKIGNFDCHYEVIFYVKGDGVRTDVPFVEVHFESPSYKSFQGIELPEGLAYENWEKKDGRIVYTDGGDERLSSVAVIERIRKLDRQIGKDLRAAFDSQIPKANEKKPHAAESAKAYAGDKCEICADREVFLTNSERNFTEAHHLIPLSKQGDFENSLNQEQNIVCLCPNCHKEIHHGMNKLELVEELWNQRKTELKAAGIGINLSDLKAYYA
ncbi:MAG: hypothetical protein HDR32_06690 [Treponema sp.]|nr:hypothetical protein [Treponema sp.]